MIKLFQKWLVFCLACTLLGCQASSPSAVLVEEKDVSNELLKRVARISDQSDTHTFQSIIFDLILNTYEKNEHGLFYQGETTYQEPDEESPYLRLNESAWGRMEAFLVTSSDLYEVEHMYFDTDQTEEREKKEEANGYLFADWQAQDVLSVAGVAIDDFPDFFAPHPLVEINSIPGYTFVEKPNHSSFEEMAESFKYSAIEPLTDILYSSDTYDVLINPQNYHYSLTVLEDQYFWTITQKIKEASPLEQPWSLEITMDEKGIISFVKIHQPMIWVKGDERLVSEANRHLSIQPLSQDQKTFMETFFLAMKEDRVALGDTFTLFEPFPSQ